MKTLFIGHFVTDINIKLSHLPQADEKITMQERRSSFGGNAVTAAFAAARLGGANRTDLMTQVAQDSKASFETRAAHNFGLTLHACSVKRSSENIVLITGNSRSIVKAPETDDFRKLQCVPEVEMTDYDILHVDCTMHDVALAYAQKAREAGVMTSLDGSRYNDDVDTLLNHIDVAVVSEDFMNNFKTVSATFDFLKNKGVKIGAITMGDKGVAYFDTTANIADAFIPAYAIPADHIESTNGAGDIFHGAYVASYAKDRSQTWHQHFTFAAAASAFAVQRFTNMESCPTETDIQFIQQNFKQK